MKPATIFYATRNSFKTEELKIISDNESFVDELGASHRIGNLIEFRISGIPTDEPLEIDLVTMVHHKVRSAYRNLLAPCIAEHAGLILDSHLSAGFPGGLTQPMWDSLSVDDFLARTGGAGERATARSVVGYCDGMRIKTFVGETTGKLATEARGSRAFYWDVIFCPDGGNGKTYAELVESGADGLKQKLRLSQSTKALTQFATFLSTQGGSGLFPI
jgi:XTP/dITP diphosphohydrolase